MTYININLNFIIHSYMYDHCLLEVKMYFNF